MKKTQPAPKSSKPRMAEAGKVTVCYVIEAWQAEAIKRLAEQDDRPASSIARKLLAKALEQAA